MLFGEVVDRRWRVPGEQDEPETFSYPTQRILKRLLG